MLQKIKGFGDTKEAQKVEAQIIERHSGAELFAPAVTAPAVKHTLNVPRL